MRQKGLDGEFYAAKYLESKGYKIIDRNFHSRFGEIDIIAKENYTIVFVEVKLRSNSFFGTPLESITYKKLEKIKKTAMYYLTLNNLANRAYRFDAVEIKIGVNNERTLNHVENITL